MLKLAKPPVLLLELLEQRNHRSINATALRPLLLARRRADASLTTQLRDRFAHLGKFEHRHDLAVRKPRLAHLEPLRYDKIPPPDPPNSWGELPPLLIG